MPRKYRPAVGERICELISQGHGLRKIVDVLHINRGDIARWLLREPEFRKAYDCAYVLWCETKSLEMLDIASDESVDHNTRRLQIDSLKFLIANRMQSRWGKRIRGDENDPLNCRS